MVFFPPPPPPLAQALSSEPSPRAISLARPERLRRVQYVLPRQRVGERRDGRPPQTGLAFGRTKRAAVTTTRAILPPPPGTNRASHGYNANAQVHGASRKSWPELRERTGYLATLNDAIAEKIEAFELWLFRRILKTQRDCPDYKY